MKKLLYLSCICFIAPTDKSALAKTKFDHGSAKSSSTGSASTSSVKNSSTYVSKRIDPVFRAGPGEEPPVEFARRRLTPRELAIEDTKCFPDHHVDIEEIQCWMPGLILPSDEIYFDPQDITRKYMRYQDLAIIAYEYLAVLLFNDNRSAEEDKAYYRGKRWIEGYREDLIDELEKAEGNIPEHEGIRFKAMTEEQQEQHIAIVDDAREQFRQYVAEDQRREAERERLKEIRRKEGEFWPSMKKSISDVGAFFGICKDPKDAAEEAKTGVNPDPRQAASSSRNHLS